MVRESEMRQIEKATDKTTAQPDSSTVRNAIAKDQDRLTPGSKPASASSSETSGSTTPGRPTETASRQQTRPDQNSQTGSAELDEADTGCRDAGAADPERPADAK